MLFRGAFTNAANNVFLYLNTRMQPPTAVMPTEELYDDMQLFSRIAAGSHAAFQVLFNNYRGRLYALALKMVKSPVVAEEIVQDVFMSVWENRERFTAITNPDSYIFTIAYHRVFRYLKKAAKETRLLEEIIAIMGDAANATEETVTANESSRLIDKAVYHLPSQRRTIYELSRNNGLSHEEIARHLNISRNTVKNQLVLALKYIRTALQKGVLLLLLLLTWRGH